MADFSYQLFITGTLFGIIEKDKKKEKNDFFFLLGKKKNGEEKKCGFHCFLSLLTTTKKMERNEPRFDVVMD